LSLGCSTFRKIKEKKIENRINNDLAVTASQMPEGAVHDKRGELLLITI